MHIDAPTLIVFSAFELFGLIAIVRVWRRKQKMRVISRIAWTLVLLVPFFGLLFYGLVRSEPDSHSDRVPNTGHVPQAFDPP